VIEPGGAGGRNVKIKILSFRGGMAPMRLECSGQWHPAAGTEGRPGSKEEKEAADDCQHSRTRGRRRQGHRLPSAPWRHMAVHLDLAPPDG
jgi:hypothetical protein